MTPENTGGREERMDKKSNFSEGDLVRIKQGAFASFFGKVVRVNNENERLTVEGRFEGGRDSDVHIVNVGFSIVEKIGPTQIY